MTIESSAPLYRRIDGFLRRHSWPLCFLLTAVASIRIVSSYTVFSFTSDEPVHVAASIRQLREPTPRGIVLIFLDKSAIRDAGCSIRLRLASRHPYTCRFARISMGQGALCHR